MIAVDTSALMAIALDEPEAEVCIAALEAEDEVVISAGTLAETLIVAASRNIGEEVADLVEALGFDVLPVTRASAQRVAQAYEQWGKGRNTTALNFGDCFAYEVAKAYNCPLLYVGNDFAGTDVIDAKA